MLPLQIKDLLSVQTGRKQVDTAVEILRNTPELIAELWNIYFSEEEPYSRKAAWVLDTGSENSEGWVAPYLEPLIEKLPVFQQEALVRHGLRMLSRETVPDHLKASLINVCFDKLMSTSTAVAIKFHAINILVNFTKEFPELRSELAGCIEFQLEDGTPGFKSIGRKVLAGIYREMS